MPTKMLAAVPNPSTPPQSHGTPQHPGEGFYNDGKDLPVEQKRRKGTHDEHERKSAKGKNVAQAGALLFKGKWATPQETEYETGPSPGGLLKGLNNFIQPDKKGLGAG